MTLSTPTVELGDDFSYDTSPSPRRKRIQGEPGTISRDSSSAEPSSPSWSVCFEKVMHRDSGFEFSASVSRDGRKLRIECKKTAEALDVSLPPLLDTAAIGASLDPSLECSSSTISGSATFTKDELTRLGYNPSYTVDLTGKMIESSLLNTYPDMTSASVRITDEVGREVRSFQDCSQIVLSVTEFQAFTHDMCLIRKRPARMTDGNHSGMVGDTLAAAEKEAYERRIRELEERVDELESYVSKKESMIQLLSDEQESQKDEIAQLTAELYQSAQEKSELKKQVKRLASDLGAMFDIATTPPTASPRPKKKRGSRKGTHPGSAPVISHPVTHAKKSSSLSMSLSSVSTTTASLSVASSSPRPRPSTPSAVPSQVIREHPSHLGIGSPVAGLMGPGGSPFGSVPLPPAPSGRTRGLSVGSSYNTGGSGGSPAGLTVGVASQSYSGLPGYASAGSVSPGGSVRSSPGGRSRGKRARKYSADVPSVGLSTAGVGTSHGRRATASTSERLEWNLLRYDPISHTISEDGLTISHTGEYDKKWHSAFVTREFDSGTHSVDFRIENSKKNHFIFGIIEERSDLAKVGYGANNGFLYYPPKKFESGFAEPARKGDVITVTVRIQNPIKASLHFYKNGKKLGSSVDLAGRLDWSLGVCFMVQTIHTNDSIKIVS